MPGEAARSGAAPVVLGMAGRPRSARALKMAPALTCAYVLVAGLAKLLISVSVCERVCFF